VVSSLTCGAAANGLLLRVCVIAAIRGLLFGYDTARRDPQQGHVSVKPGQLGCELPRRRPPSSLGNLITRQGTFFLYAAIGVGAFVFFLARVPETKDRTLEQIQDYLNIAAVHPTKESV